MDWAWLIVGGLGLILIISDEVESNSRKNANKNDYPSNGEVANSHTRNTNSKNKVDHNTWDIDIHGKLLTPGSFWYERRKEVFERDGYVCSRCGANKNLTIDHKIPLSLGGDSALGNLSVLCRNCHENKDQRILFDRGFDAKDNYGKNPSIKRKIRLISLALENNETIRIKYTDIERNKTNRIVEPERIKVEDGRIYLIGFCRLRNDSRTFRISRMTIME